jgi:hypothetical protein
MTQEKLTKLQELNDYIALLENLLKVDKFTYAA